MIDLTPQLHPLLLAIYTVCHTSEHGCMMSKRAKAEPRQCKKMQRDQIVQRLRSKELQSLPPEDVYASAMKMLALAPANDEHVYNHDALDALSLSLHFLRIPEHKRASLASRVISVWSLHASDIPAHLWHSLCTAANVALEQCRSVAPVLILCRLLCSAEEAAPMLVCPTTLAHCAATNDAHFPDAHALAAQHHSSFGPELVHALQEAGKLKFAYRTALTTGLESALSSLRLQIKLRSVEQYLQSGKLSIACFLTRTEPVGDIQSHMRHHVLNLLPKYATHGSELMDAADLLDEPPDTLKWLAEQADLPLSEPEGSLKLDVPVEVADSQLKLREGVRRLLSDGNTVVGLDAEWRPTRNSSSCSSSASAGSVSLAAAADTNRACESIETEVSESAAASIALLQLASERFALLVDVVNLSAEEIEQELGALLRSESIVKVGFQVKGDIARLQQGLADVPSIHALNGVMDLRSMWTLAMGKSLPKGGLSGLCKRVLGSYIAKGMQMSDWERRPLSSRQQQYAALDALACARLYNELERCRIHGIAQPVLGFDAVQQDVQQYGRLQVTGCSESDCWSGSAVSAASRAGVASDRVAKALGLVSASLSAYESQNQASALATGAGGLPVLVVLPGDRQASMDRIAQHLQLPSASALRFAGGAECVELFGHRPGTIPPGVGLRSNSNVNVVVDTALHCAGSAQIVAGAGDEAYELRGPAEDVIAAANASVARVSDKSPSLESVESGSTDCYETCINDANYSYVVDGGLGRLARWLRALGLDTVYVPSQRKAAHVLRLKQLCEFEGRVLVTGNKSVAQWAEQSDRRKCVCVQSDSPRQQLQQVTKEFPVMDPSQMLTRCNSCNGRVGHVGSKLSAAEALERNDVPQWIARDHSVWVCTNCGKSFWDGYAIPVYYYYCTCVIIKAIGWRRTRHLTQLCMLHLCEYCRPKSNRALSMLNDLTETAVFQAHGQQAQNHIEHAAGQTALPRPQA